MTKQDMYTDGGTVQAGPGLYISRAADDDLLALCRAGSFAYVLTPRQLGKSSLMVRTAEQLTKEGVHSVTIDLSQIGVQLTAEQWYLGLLSVIEEQLNLGTNVVKWWQERAHLGITQRLTLFFQEVLLREVSAPVVIFVDEIDTTLSLNFTDDFFAAIRYFYNARALSKDLQRLSFVLIGVATPGDLIRDPQRTPFNIGQRVDLTDFTFEEALPLAAGFGLADKEAQQVLRWVLKWTSGHPYLTQHLCRAVAYQGRSSWSDTDIDRIVASTFFLEKSKQDDNLRFVRDMLTERVPAAIDAADVITTYRDVRRGKLVPDEEQSLVKSHLKLSGIVRRENNVLRVRNQIYNEVFDNRWIKEHLPGTYLRKRLRRVAAVAAVFAFIAVSFAVLGAVALGYAKEARRQQGIAEQQRQSAIEAKQKADVAAKHAEEQSRIAEARRAEAEEERQRAQRATQREQIARLQAVGAATQERLARLRAEELRNTADEQRQLAQHESKIALSRQLAAQASNQSDSQFDLKLLLGVEASRADATYEARSLLLTSLKLNPQLVTFLDGHKSAVHGLAFSADGKTLVSGGSDNTLRLWDTATGRPIGRPLTDLYTYGISSVAFSPDGKTIAAGGSGSIVLCDITASQPQLRRLSVSPTSNVWGLAFSPDGKTLASGADYGGEVILWDIATRKPKGQPMTLHKQHVWSVAFSPDGKTLASSSEDQTIILWDVETQQPRGLPLAGHGGGVWSVTFSRDGRILASGDNNGNIILWNVAGRSKLATLIGNGWVRSLAFGKDSDTLIVGGNYGNLKRWYSISSGSPFSEDFHVPNETVWTVAVSPDGETFASGSDDGTVIMWNVWRQRSLGRELIESSVHNLAFSPDGKTLALADNDKTIRLLNITTGLPIGAPLTGHDASTLVFSPDGTILASVDGDRTTLLNVNTGLPIGTVLTHPGTEALAFSPDGKTLASGGCGKFEKREYRGQKNDTCVQGEILTWDVATRQPSGRPLVDDQIPVTRLAFSPDGRMLASANFRKFVLWAVATRQPVWSDSAEDVTFSHDGKTLATVTNTSVVFWSVATHERLRSLPLTREDEVHSVELSSDGDLLLSIGRKWTLWDLATRQPLLSESAIKVTLSPDNKTLATVSEYGGKVTLWDIDLESWKTRACLIANRNLTWQEWQQYLEHDPYGKTCRDLPINPSFLDEGRRLAKEGEIQSALTILRRATELEPGLQFDAENEARRLEALGKGEKLLARIDELSRAEEDQINEATANYRNAVAAYTQALKFGPTPEISNASQTFNNLCWYGSLRGHPNEVMDACERTVTIDPTSWHFRDSRGLARALTGNLKGAITDFQEFIRGTDDEEKRSQRQRWINALGEGKNPFTPEELKILRGK